MAYFHFEFVERDNRTGTVTEIIFDEPMPDFSPEQEQAIRDGMRMVSVAASDLMLARNAKLGQKPMKMVGKRKKNNLKEIARGD